MRTDGLFEVILGGEGQTVEFKESLSSGAKREAIETMVAFVNSQGGRLFFGVRDDGRAQGVQVGRDTQERLAKLVGDHTYPSLPFVVDDPFLYEGKTVLSIEIPHDVPPIIGIYLSSERPIANDQAVDARKLQAFRRIGRTNQKEDFMWLRPPQPADPKVRLVVVGRDSALSSPGVQVRVWAEDGSPTAHQVTLRMDPPILQSDAVINDLPFPETMQSSVPLGEKFHWYTRGVEYVVFSGAISEPVPGSAQIVARYNDDAGVTWEASRFLRFEVVTDSRDQSRHLIFEDGGKFARRIVEFPPKVR